MRRDTPTATQRLPADLIMLRDCEAIRKQTLSIWMALQDSAKSCSRKVVAHNGVQHFEMPSFILHAIIHRPKVGHARCTRLMTHDRFMMAFVHINRLEVRGVQSKVAHSQISATQWQQVHRKRAPNASGGPVGNGISVNPAYHETTRRFKATE